MAENGNFDRSGRFPWVALVLLLLSIVAFWVLPSQFKQQPVRVEFVDR